MDPATGTFLSVDPLVSVTGMPYLYGNGNPVTFSDPEGLEAGSWLNGSYEYAAWQRNRGRSSAQLSKRNEELKGLCGGLNAGCGSTAEGLIMHEENLLLGNRRPGDNWYTGSEIGEKVLFTFLGGGLTAGVAPVAAGVAGVARGASLSFVVNFPRLTALLTGTTKLGLDLVDDNPGGGADDALRVLTASERRAVTSLERQVADHTAKLAAYRASPDAFDNLGILANAPTEAIRQSIIDGRIRHLSGEIRAFQDQIGKLLGGAG